MFLRNITRLPLLLLAALPATAGNNLLLNGNFAAGKAHWEGGPGEIVRESGDPELVLRDRSTTDAVYVISDRIPIDRASGYLLCGMIRSHGVSSAAKAYVQVFDPADKRLASFGSNGVSGDSDWVGLKLRIAPEQWPPNAAAVRISLQPATGAATETGEAAFRGLSLVRDTETADPTRIGLDPENWEGMPVVLRHLPDAGEVFELTDSAADAGSYLTTVKRLPVDPALDYEFQFSALPVDVTTATRGFVFAVDAAGKRLADFGSDNLTAPEWRRCAVKIAAADWPQGTTGAVLMLQPAAGPAEGVGTARFKDIRFRPIQAPAALPGRDFTALAYFKFGEVELLNGRLLKSPFFRKPERPTLEISWRNPEKLASLQLVTDAPAPKQLAAACWNEPEQRFDPPQAVPVAPAGDSWVIDLGALPETRKILLEFAAGEEHPVFDDAILRLPDYPVDNWDANWIWYTVERVDSVNACFRRVIDLPSAPVAAWIQCAADDGGEIAINGKPVGGGTSWKHPADRNVTAFFHAGKNIVTAKVVQYRYSAGLLAEIDFRFADGSTRKVKTDSSWKVTPGDASGNWKALEFDDRSWQQAVELCRPPHGDWGPVPYVVHGARTGLELAAAPIPATLAAGEHYEFRFELANRTPGTTPGVPGKIMLCRDGCEFWQGSLGIIDGKAATQTLTVPLTVNPFMVPGEYEIRFETPGFRLTRNGHPYQPKVTIANARKAAPPVSEMRRHRGVSTLFVDGQPYYLLMHANRYADTVEASGRRFSAEKIDFYSVYTILEMPREGEVTFAKTDQVITLALAGNPDAKLFVRIELRDSVPGWFTARYPDECARFDAGAVRGNPSLASLQWRETAGNGIRKLIEHIRQAPYADKVVGYFIYEGEEGQWMHYWGSDNPKTPNTLSDYSKPMQTYFRNWLKRKYRSDDALQQAWNNPAVTLAAAPIPSREERLAAEGVFRDPAKVRNVLDYAEAHSDVVCDGIEYYGKLFKEATANTAVVGALYGHIIDLGGTWMGENVGYFKQHRAVTTPYIDLYGGPLNYFDIFRDVGGTSSFDFPPPASLRLHNKLWLNEDDTRTHLTDPPGYAYSMHDAEATSEMAAREFAKGLCGAAGMYFYDLSGGARNWFDDPELMATFGELRQIAGDAVNHDTTPQAEIAVVMSDISLSYMRQIADWPTNRDDVVMQLIFGREQIGRIGAPFDEYLLDDVLLPDAPDYKLYIFLNTFCLTAEQRAAILDKLNRNHATALWYYAPGIFDEKGCDPALAEALTGSALSFDHTRRGGVIRYGDGSNWGCQDTFAPTLRPARAEETLAVFPTDGAPALVRNGRNYFSAVPKLSTTMLRTIAERAGVAIFSRDDDAVYYCASYMALHTGKHPGPRKLLGPAGKKLRQLWPRPDHPDARYTEYTFENRKPRTIIFAVED